MKRLLALILVFALFAPTAVFADDTGWSISYVTLTQNEDDCYAQISEAQKYHQEKSMYIKSQSYGASSGYYDGTKYIELKNSLTGALPTGNYTLTFYARRDTNFSSLNIISVSGQVNVGYSDMQKDALSDGWTEYMCSFNYTEQSESYLSFKMAGRTTGVYIDKVSLVNDTTGIDYVVDGSFEDYSEPEVPETPYDRTGYQLEQMFASPLGEEGMVLSWKNPDVAGISKISVYNITDGANTLLTDSVTKTRNTVVYHQVTGLERNTQYQFKIVFEFTDKASDTYFLYGKTQPVSESSKTVGGWTLANWRVGAAEACPGEIYIDTTENHTPGGSAALKIVSHLNSLTYTGNIYLTAYHASSMSAGKKYRISFWMKGENLSASPSAKINWETMTFKSMKAEDGTDLGAYVRPTNVWKQYVYEHEYQNENAFRILYENAACDALWLDDVEIYEIDADGNVVTDLSTGAPLPNQIDEGDFEGLAAVTSGTLSNAVAAPGVGSVILSDFSAAGNYDRINIYQLMFPGDATYEHYEYRGSIPKGCSSVTIDNLSKGKEYFFRLIPENADKIEGTGVDVSATTILPDYEIYEAKLYNQAGTQIPSLQGAGNYSVRIPVKNNMLAQNKNFPCELIVGLYENGALKTVFSNTANVVPKTPGAEPTNVSVPISVPSGTGYILKAFLIDSRSEFVHLCPGYTFE